MGDRQEDIAKALYHLEAMLVEIDRMKDEVPPYDEKLIKGLRRNCLKMKRLLESEIGDQS